MSTFTAGVFQDLEWARRGVLALFADGFAPATITLLVRESPGATTLIAETIGGPRERIELEKLGPVLAFGPLLTLIQDPDDPLRIAGLAATMRRAGFQAHDGHIFETLVARGGVLTAVSD